MRTGTEINNIINEFADGIKIIFGERLVDIILFGSYARGDYENGSDVDIAILADIRREEEKLFTNDIITLISEIDIKFNYTVLLSPILISNDFYVEWRETIPFYQALLNEGVGLFA